MLACWLAHAGFMSSCGCTHPGCVHTWLGDIRGVHHSPYAHGLFCLSLACTHQDAARMRDKLRSDCGFTDVDARFDASRSDLLRAMSQLASAAHSGPQVLLFYFSGHGCEKHGVNYLATVDGDRVNLNEEVIAPLNMSGHQHIIIIILDCCRRVSLCAAETGGLSPCLRARGSTCTAPHISTAEGACAVSLALEPHNCALGCRSDSSNQTFRAKGEDDEDMSSGGPMSAAAFRHSMDTYAKSAPVRANDFLIVYACDPGRFAYESSSGGRLTLQLLKVRGVCAAQRGACAAQLASSCKANPPIWARGLPGGLLILPAVYMGRS